MAVLVSAAPVSAASSNQRRETAGYEHALLSVSVQMHAVLKASRIILRTPIHVAPSI
jgi:hypothetical protein